MDEKTKEPEVPNTLQDPDSVENSNPLASNTTDPVKLFSILQSDSLAVNSDYICIASDNTLKIIKNSIEEFKLFSFNNQIKFVEISKISDSIVIVLENFGFIILDIESENQQQVVKTSEINLVKWNNWDADKIGVFADDNNLEVFFRGNLSESVKIGLKDCVCFEFSAENSIVFQDSEFKCRILSVEDSNNPVSVPCGKNEKIEKIVVFDKEKFAFKFSESIEVVSLSSGIMFSLGHKQIFEYDIKSDYVYLGNPGSLQVLIISKENFIGQKYQDCVAYFTLMESCSQIIIRKKNDKPQVVARHGDDIFFYTFRTEVQTEEPLPEIKEFSPPKASVKAKKPAERSQPKLINPKEIISPIVNALNKNLEDCVKRVEKSISPHNLNTLVTKTIQSTLEQKIDAASQKSIIQSTLTQSLRYEFQSSLIPVIQQQLNENFLKISSLFQESIKTSSDYNNRSSAKTSSLESHMKNAIDNISNTTSRLEKEYLAEIKKINEIESRLSESFEPKKQEDLIIVKSVNSKTEALKKDIDQKLRNLDFEGAITTVLREKNPGYLFKVLEMLNPKSLCSSRIIREPLLKQLFYELIDNVEKDLEFKEFYVWTEEIVKNMNLKEEATQLIVKLFNISEKKPKIREIIKIITMKIG